tara:strand:- start:171 stop:416 length:246 start_codon:yes stop_codon:yes gene_type:complete
MKPIEKKADQAIAVAVVPPRNEATTGSEIIMLLTMIAAMCLTLLITTRMYVNSALISDMISHYSLRGKDVMVQDNQLVFVN